MKRFLGILAVLVSVTACGERLVYRGSLETNGMLYEARLVVLPQKEQATATIWVMAVATNDVVLQSGVMDLVSPLGAHSMSSGPATVDRFLLSKGDRATISAQWRVINDPFLYQLYNMPGEEHPSNYLLDVSRLFSQHDMFQESIALVVTLDEDDYARHRKRVNPILRHYKISPPQDFKTIQKEYMKETGWLRQAANNLQEEVSPTFFFMTGNHTILMDGRYHLGFYAFAQRDTITMKVTLANREADRIQFIPERLLLFVDGTTVAPSVLKSSQEREAGGFTVHRNKRGEWFLSYPVNNAPTTLELQVNEAFLSMTAVPVPLFGVESIGLTEFTR